VPVAVLSRKGVYNSVAHRHAHLPAALLCWHLRAQGRVLNPLMNFSLHQVVKHLASRAATSRLCMACNAFSVQTA
jgi:hypothetical protein